MGHLVAWRLENDSPVRAQMVTVVTASYLGRSPCDSLLREDLQCDCRVERVSRADEVVDNMINIERPGLGWSE